MTINNALASLAVNDIKAARQWYETLIGRPADSTQMPDLAEWKFAGGGPVPCGPRVLRKDIERQDQCDEYVW